MEYQNIIKFSGNIPNQTNEFRTEKWVEINHD